MKMYVFKIVLFGYYFPGKITFLQSLDVPKEFKTWDVPKDLPFVRLLDLPKELRLGQLTSGVSLFHKVFVVDKQEVSLQIWDLSVEKRFRFFLPSYIIGAHGGMFLYDIKNYSTLAHIGDWLSLFRQERGGRYPPEDKPTIMVGIIPDEKDERQVTTEEGKRIAKDLKVSGFIECNPKTGENVEKVFETLTRLILDRFK